MKITINCFVLPLSLVLAASRGITSRSTVRMSSTHHQLVLDSFGARQFNNPDYIGTQIQFSEVEFEKSVNQAYRNGAPLVDGYAPFW